MSELSTDLLTKQIVVQSDLEEKESESEQLLKHLIEATSDYAIFALDTQGFILTWNKGAQRLNGYKEHEILGQHFSKFYTQTDITRGHPANELHLASSSGRYEEEGWRIRKDGTQFWANVIITPFRNANGCHIGFAKVVRDLSERKKAEEMRREEENKFKLMVESVKDYAILMLDPRGNVSSWNEGAKHLKGFEANEILGQHFSQFYPSEEVRAQKPAMELEIAKATGRFEDEGWRVKKDGSRFWANAVITPVYNKYGCLLGFSKVTRDLSERKKTEEVLKSAYEGLEVRIAEKTSQLEEALRSRDEFLSIASHELKTPVTGMKMQIQMAIRRLKNSAGEPVDASRQLRSLEIAENQLTRLTRLIDDLLDISRIQSGKLTYTFELTNFSSLFEEVMECFSGQLVHSKTEIKTFIDPALQGWWDRSRVEQVFINLISNALKYAQGSQIIIFAKQDSNGKDAFITVQDFGPGIPENVRGKIFGRFERLGQTHNIGGLGLGLYISKQIVNAHGGRIKVKSGNEKGTVFIISLPLDSRPKQRVPRESIYQLQKPI